MYENLYLNKLELTVSMSWTEFWAGGVIDYVFLQNDRPNAQTH